MKLGGKRLTIAGALIVGMGLCGAGAYAGKQQLDRKSACDSVQAFVQQNGEVIHATTGNPRVGILGDSYVMGDGLKDRTEGWAYLIGEANGWDVNAAGISSTGYTAGGFCGGHAYGERLPTLLNTQPETLIIQGGLNDWEAAPEDIETSAGKVISDATGVSRVVVVGPVNAPSRAEKLPAVDSALEEAAESNGATYISALDWELEFLPDGLHLTPAGHARLSEMVSERITSG